MTIFHDRIVLSDGTVIMPEGIKGVHYVMDSLPPFDMIPIIDFGEQMHCRGDRIRIDRATGMVDSKGKEIFERDRLYTDTGYQGVVVYRKCGFYIKLDMPIDGDNEDDWYIELYVPHNLTVTGHQTWEECHE